jgi:hypothetical protein
MTKTLTCCICEKKIEPEPLSGWAGGANPAPISLNPDDRCCRTCDETVVIPARMRLAFQKNKIREIEND